MKYKHLAIGGTFDRLHSGHNAFLDEAFRLAERVSIGLSEDSFITSKKFANQILPYSKRKQELETFLKLRNYLDRTTLFPLHDIYGIAGDDSTVDVILVTPDTYENAQKINKKRIESGLALLEVRKINLVIGQDKAPIQSEKIREGKIDRTGFTFESLFQDRILHLPEILREELRKPLGQVILQAGNNEDQTTKKAISFIQKENPPLLIAVGDIIVKYLRQNNFTADVEIIDNRTRRTELVVHHTSSQSILNEQGTINSHAVSILSLAIKKFQETGKKQEIIIFGEEDLLALPAILLSPLGAVILYGQWDLGIVVIKVTEAIKTTARKLISQFSTSGVE